MLLRTDTKQINRRLNRSNTSVRIGRIGSEVLSQVSVSDGARIIDTNTSHIVSVAGIVRARLATGQDIEPFVLDAGVRMNSALISITDEPVIAKVGVRVIKLIRVLYTSELASVSIDSDIATNQPVIGTASIVLNRFAKNISE